MQCDKCAFIYLLLSAWLDADYINEVVFAKHDNLLGLGKNSSHCIEAADSPQETKQYLHATNSTSTTSEVRNMTTIFKSLLQSSTTWNKPFDCVGTAKEAKAAFVLTLWRFVKSYEQQKDAIIWPPRVVELCIYLNIDYENIEYWQSFSDEESLLSVFVL